MSTRLLWILLILAVPAPALARAAGRLLVLLYALPLVIPLLGIAGASFGLRVTSSKLLWRTLSVLLGVNSALVARVLVEQPGEVTGFIFLLGHIGMAGSMLFTVPEKRDGSKARLVLGRLPGVALLGVVPGLLIGAFVR